MLEGANTFCETCRVVATQLFRRYRGFGWGWDGALTPGSNR